MIALFFVPVLGYGLCFRWFMCRLWPLLRHRPVQPFLTGDTIGYMVVYTILQVIAFVTLTALGVLR